jgi:transporter family protein
MTGWFSYAIGAAVLYGLHQIFTKLASNRIVVEATAALTITLYLLYLRFFGKWEQAWSGMGAFYSVFTGICVGAGTIFFFLLFQKGGPLSAVPMVLAGGAAIMAIVGILFFKEPAYWQRLLGIFLSIAGLLLLRYKA